MILKYDNLWNSKDDIILVTANSYINQKGELVMGRGAALELKNRIPWISREFGLLIENCCGHLGYYGYLLADNVKNKTYGIFQVKYHFKDNASLDLIEKSTYELHAYVYNLPQKISMNFPGIGFGHLSEKDVMPIIEKLPDNVTIYKQ